MTTRSVPWPHPSTPHRPAAAGRWMGSLAHRLAALWQRLTEDEDASFLRDARDLEDLEHRLRLLEQGRHQSMRAALRGHTAEWL